MSSEQFDSLTTLRLKDSPACGIGRVNALDETSRRRGRRRHKLHDWAMLCSPDYMDYGIDTVACVGALRRIGGVHQVKRRDIGDLL